MCDFEIMESQASLDHIQVNITFLSIRPTTNFPVFLNQGVQTKLRPHPAKGKEKHQLSVEHCGCQREVQRFPLYRLLNTLHPPLLPGK
jgi:hypothetical protein